MQHIHIARIGILAAALLAIPVAGQHAAQAEQAGARVYEVTFTNLSVSQPLSPPLLVTHDAEAQIFAVGEPATPGLQAIAENGNNRVLAEALQGLSGVDDIVATEMPLHRVGGDGSTTMTVTVMAHGNADRLSLASMLACTNDGFVGVDGVRLPRTFTANTIYASAYDAGTEANSQLWQDLPGGCNLIGPVPTAPDQMNRHPATTEPVHVHPGITPGVGDLSNEFAWTDPTLMISVRRVE